MNLSFQRGLWGVKEAIHEVCLACLHVCSEGSAGLRGEAVCAGAPTPWPGW